MELIFFAKQYNILIKTLTSKENLPSLEELESKLTNDKLYNKLNGDENEDTLFVKKKTLPPPNFSKIKSYKQK